MKLAPLLTNPITVAILSTVSAQAAIVSLTSVDQLEFSNVIKAYDFTSSNSIAANGSNFNIGGVTFTRYNWNSDTTFDNLTLTGDLTIDNQNSGAPNITTGGTATDRNNLNALLDVWNIGNQGGTEMVLTIDGLANGDYRIQYLVGTNNDRHNTIYYEAADTSRTLLGSFDSNGSANYLITADVAVTDGNLRIIVADNVDAANGDNRRIVSGLIVSQIPEPSAALLGGFGALLLLRRRRHA